MTLTILRADARFLATGNSSNSTDFSDTDLDRLLNQYYHKAGNIAMQYGGDWQPFGEITTIDMEAGQREYLLTDTDVNLRRIQKVWIKIDGTYVPATKRDVSNFQTLDETTYTVYPPEYDLLEDSIFIYTSDSSIPTVAAGIRIYCQTDITELSSAGDIPQLPDVLQKYLSLGAAYEFCLSKKDGAYISLADRIKNELLTKEEEVMVFYSNRANDADLKLVPASDETMSGDDLY